jgi:anti-sigma regulatory factor (Ser/Thr protein kinase)
VSDLRIELRDHERLRLVVDVLDQSDDYTVVGTAGDRQETIDLVAREHPDAVVLDGDVLDDADDVAIDLREESPETRVFVLRSGEPRVPTTAVDGVIDRAMRPTRVVAEISAVLQRATRTVAAELPRDLASAATARRLTREATAAWGVGGLDDTLALLATELVANAVRHADSTAEIAIRLEDDVVRVEIRDRSSEVPTPGSLVSQRESGRGLALVEALSDAWGIEPHDDGKSVWFELARGR